jgi:ribosomal protein L17
MEEKKEELKDIEEEETPEELEVVSIEALEEAEKKAKEYWELAQQLKSTWAISDVKLRKKALKLLKSNDFTQFIIKTVQENHKGDEGQSIICVLSFLSSGLKYKLNLMAVGEAGIGKTDLMEACSHLFPERWVFHQGGMSPLAMFYMNDKLVKDKSFKNHYLFLFDDVREQSIEALKLMTTNKPWNEKITHSTVNDKVYKSYSLSNINDYVVWCSKVTALRDENNQLTDRLIVFNPDETIDHRRQVQAIIQDKEAWGASKNYGTKSYLLCQSAIDLLKLEIINLINIARKKDDLDIAVVPFATSSFMKYNNPCVNLAEKDLIGNRANKQFISLIKACTLLNLFKRSVVNGYQLVAEKEDFDLAAQLWLEIAETHQLKVDVKQKMILDVLRGSEAPEVDGKIVTNPDKTYDRKRLSKITGMNPSTLATKLSDLFDNGLIDRDKVGYAFYYWSVGNRGVAIAEVNWQDYNAWFFDELKHKLKPFVSKYGESGDLK